MYNIQTDSYKLKYKKDASKFFVCIPSPDSYIINNFSSNEDYYFFINNFSKYKFHFSKEEVESYIFGRDASLGTEKKEFIRRNLSWGNLSTINNTIILVDLVGNVEYITESPISRALSWFDLDLSAVRYNKYYTVTDLRIEKYIKANKYVDLYNNGNNSFYINFGDSFKEYKHINSIAIFKSLLRHYNIEYKSIDTSQLVTEYILNNNNEIDPGFYLSQYDTIVYNTYKKINTDIGRTKIKSDKSIEELYLGNNTLAFNPFEFFVSSRTSDNKKDKNVEINIHLNEENYIVTINSKKWGMLKNLKISNLYKYYALAENWMYMFICNSVKITPFNYLVNDTFLSKIINNNLLLNKLVKRVELFSIKNYDGKDNDDTVRYCSAIINICDRFNNTHYLFLDFRLSVMSFYLRRLYDNFNNVLNGNSYISSDLTTNIEKAFLYEMSYSYSISNKRFNSKIEYNLCMNITNSLILNISSIINHIANTV